MARTGIETAYEKRCFGGAQGVYVHASRETQCAMRFGVFLPPAARTRRVPVLYWLSGLTCTEDNFIVKAGAQRMAAELGLALVVPDTSPRGLGLAGEGDSYDFGLGAGFYVDATEAPWSRGYRMYSYVCAELPALVAEHFPVDATRAGHLRALDGRARRAGRGAAQPAGVPKRLRVRADRRADALPLGRERVRRVPRSRPRALGARTTPRSWSRRTAGADRRSSSTRAPTTRFSTRS